MRIKPNPKALEIIKPLYEKLKSLESGGGISSSEAYLNKLLQEKGATYDEFIVAIQEA